MSDFVLARKLADLGRRPPVVGWNELVDALHATCPLSRVATLVLCDLHCDAETRRIDVVTLLAATGGRAAESRLVRYLDDPSARVVGAAIRALGRCGTHRCTRALGAVRAPHGPAGRRALALVQARLGRVEGAVSEAVPHTDGAVSVVKRRAAGRLSVDPGSFDA